MPAIRALFSFFATRITTDGDAGLRIIAAPVAGAALPSISTTNSTIATAGCVTRSHT